MALLKNKNLIKLETVFPTDTVPDIKRATTEQLQAFPKCFQSWNQCWDKCSSQGHDFERDQMKSDVSLILFLQ